MTNSEINQLRSIPFNFLSLLLQDKAGVTESGQKIDISFCGNRVATLFLKHGNFLQLSMHLMKMSQNYTAISRKQVYY